MITTQISRRLPIQAHSREDESEARPCRPSHDIASAVTTMVSIVLLAIVLPGWCEALGVSPVVLYSLALWALGCLATDLTALRAEPTTHRTWLARIMAANTTYCLITSSLLWTHRDVLTALGWGYFIAELIVLISLVYWESVVYRRP